MRLFISRKVTYINLHPAIMPLITSQASLLERLEIKILPEDLAAVMQTGTNRRNLLDICGKALATVQGSWHPRAVFRWFGLDPAANDTIMLRPLEGGEAVCLRLGHAATFMAPATYGLVGVCTAGDELDKEAAMASKEKRFMDAYVYDLIGLAVLEKTRQRLNRIVEAQAQERDWGVGPFLSPGSVHGWELENQDALCALVPIERIGVKIVDGVLKPFRTISCLIGIGQQYTSRTVGETCEVCSRRDRCDLRGQA